MVDVIKTLASQLIVWHHFVSYGPMIKTVHPLASGVLDWIYNDGRLAVQAFLVLGGYLAARSLAPQPQQLRFEPSALEVARLAWRRYLRLIRPYLVALLLALASAALARWLLDEPDTPAAPSWRQGLYHLFLLQDIVGVDALSTGVWYVGIDLQLYGLLLLLLWGSRRLAAPLGVSEAALRQWLLVGVAAASLWLFNRSTALDIWGIYFLGAYGLGVMLQWWQAQPGSRWAMLALLLAYGLALGIEWRTRLLVSLLTAALLAWSLRAGYQPGWNAARVFGWFSRISFAVFLIHYPVILLVGSVVGRFWPGDVPMAGVGLLLSWLLTLALGHAIHVGVEARAAARA